LPETAYDAAGNRAVAAELLQGLAETVAAGHAAIADAMFLDPAARRGAEAAAGHAPFVGIWLTAPLPVLESRIAGRSGDASDATVEVLHRTRQADPGPMTWLEVGTSNLESALEQVCGVVRSANAAKPC
jgi:predicted kinase